jgi:tetratricopeptide (TPR) repeat protein
MADTLTTSDQSQLEQTIEMFEVITQSQPHDYQSLEILKEAYAKLGREREAVATSKRIAEAYVQMGQLSSAILEYETILQRFPDDPDVKAALARIETKANHFPVEETPTEILLAKPFSPAAAAPVAKNGAKAAPTNRIVPTDVDDGERAMRKIFVDTKVITSGDFDLCWVKPDFTGPPNGVIEPFIQLLADKGILGVERSLKILCDHSRYAYLPLDKYDVDMDLARSFPAETCRRWCLMPFDRMSKCILVATANPFNQQAAKELAQATPNRLLWYIVSPTELVKNVRKVYR